MRLFEILESLARRDFLKGAVAATIAAVNCPMCKGAHAARPALNKTLKNPRLFNDKTLLRRVYVKTAEMYNSLTNNKYANRINLQIALPNVLPSYEATPEELEKSLGIALDTNTYSINHYDRFLNRILLAPDADIDSLAHELVHFIQFKFLPFADPYSDWLESEAIAIQRNYNWRSLY